MNKCVQKSFKDDPTLSPQLFELMETTFPGLTAIAHRARTLGGAWESVSTPFMYFQDGRAIAHVGVVELPCWIRGTPVTLGGVHGVCTHPDFRQWCPAIARRCR